MASIDEAIERGVKNAFEKPQEILGGRSFNQLLAEFHTGEIAPVVHGRWTDDEYCSECGQYVYHGDMRNYCPCCGAKMDKEAGE